MLSQTSIPGTDDWYVMKLAAQWGQELPALHRLRSYVDGTVMLPIAASGSMRQAYLRFIKMHRLNVAELAVDARVNRMKPLGFRTAAAGDNYGDAVAMQTWKRSNLKVGARDFFWNASVYGRSYLLSTGPTVPSASAEPLIVPKSPWEITTIQDAARPWLTEAGLMLGYDSINQVDILTLFRPGYMRQAIRSASVSSLPSDGTPWYPGRGWDWVSDPIPLGFTQQNPLVKLELKNGKGVYETHTDTIDRINHLTLESSTIIAMQAFRQRAIQGDLPKVYPPDHERAGQLIDYDAIYQAGPAALWMLPVGAKIWESGVTDITPITNLRKDDVRNFAAMSSTPVYILQPDATNGSAEGASLAREGLVFAVEEMNDRADVALALSHSMAFEAIGDLLRSAPGEIETIWAPVDRASLQERASAAAQAKAAGLSQKTINEKFFQLTPTEIEQEAQNRQDEAFLAPTGA
jgi:hypothetical protein